MKATVITDAKILVPNPDHKNFCESADLIEEGTIIEGNRKDIAGLRKGQPFTYKLFSTNKNQLIYLNKIKPMETTEVTLGADSGQTPTLVDMKKPEVANRNKFIGAAIGAAAGFAFAKYKKHDMKRIGTYTIIGAVLGVAAAYLIDRRKDKVTIKPSK
jgi:hypothetical protein